MKTNGILLSVIIGLSQGSQPIIGFNYGAKKYDRVRGTYRLAISCNLVVSAIGFVLFQFFPKQIIALFGTGDELYFTFAVRFMRIFLFMVIVNGVQLLSSNFFAAIGKPLKGMLLSLTRQVFFLNSAPFDPSAIFRNGRNPVLCTDCRYRSIFDYGNSDP